MEGVRAPTGMSLVVLPSKLSLGWELHTAVVEQTIAVDSRIVLVRVDEEGEGPVIITVMNVVSDVYTYMYI